MTAMPPSTSGAAGQRDSLPSVGRYFAVERQGRLGGDGPRILGLGIGEGLQPPGPRSSTPNTQDPVPRNDAALRDRPRPSPARTASFPEWSRPGGSSSSDMPRQPSMVRGPGVRGVVGPASAVARSARPARLLSPLWKCSRIWGQTHRSPRIDSSRCRSPNS